LEEEIISRVSEHGFLSPWDLAEKTGRSLMGGARFHLPKLRREGKGIADLVRHRKERKDVESEIFPE
jgi:hypothetical protein